MNLIFMDLKHIDPLQHRRYTGMDNALILENLQKTAALRIPLVVRVPVILGVNRDDKTMLQIFRFLRDRVPGLPWSCCPTTAWGGEIPPAWPPPARPRLRHPSQDQLARWQRAAAELGLTVVSYR